MNHTILRFTLGSVAPIAALAAQGLPPPTPTLLRDITPGGGYGPLHLTVLQDCVWFSDNDGQVGQEIWVTDGTPQGTQLFADLNPGSAGSSPTDFCVLGDRMFSGATGQSDGQELWVTDGTVAGTHSLGDLRPGSGGSYPEFFTAYPAGWTFGTIHVPADIALDGLESLMQAYLGSTSVPSAHDFTDPGNLYLGS